MFKYFLLALLAILPAFSNLHAQDKHTDAGIYYGCSSNTVGTVEITMYLNNDCTFRIEMGFDFYGQWRSNQDSVWIYSGTWVSFDDWLLFFTEDKEAYPYDDFHFYTPNAHTDLGYKMSSNGMLKLIRAEAKQQVYFHISWDVFEEIWDHCAVTRLEGDYKSAQFDNQCVTQ